MERASGFSRRSRRGRRSATPTGSSGEATKRLYLQRQAEAECLRRVLPGDLVDAPPLVREVLAPVDRRGVVLAALGDREGVADLALRAAHAELVALEVERVRDDLQVHAAAPVLDRSA